MAATSLRAQLNTLLASMVAAGTLDEQFRHLRSLQEEGHAAPGFLAEIVNLFINDADRILTDIAALINQPEVDFQKVDTLIRQLRGSSSTVGAKKLYISCTHFRLFYEAESKGRLMALALVRSDFRDVRNKFQTMMHLEEQIAACGPI